MKAQLRPFLSFLLLLWLAVSTHAFADAARVAVIGDPSLSQLVDVTTAQLSTVPDLSLLERADLDKIGHEQDLKALVGSNDFSSLPLVPAHGLVILRAVTQNGKTGVFARLVAVKPGIVLRETALPDDADTTVQAKAIADEFASCWPKLNAIQKGNISGLSLLGLRFEVDSPTARELERKINVLLASRLSAEPDTVVLERWRLNDAVFEKSLTASQPAPFWTGSSLIDGSMKLADDQVEVTLRVRPPQGAETTITDKEKVDQLPALAARLADKIQTHPMTQGQWQPAEEADHYAQLGKWCLDNGLFGQGAEAIESALALGDNSSATLRSQIRAYRVLTFDDELPNAGSSLEPEAQLADFALVSTEVKAGTMAANLAVNYLKANSHFAGKPDAEDDPIAVSLPVLDNCLRLLRYAYQKGYVRDHENEIATLRHATEDLIAVMEPARANGSSDLHNLFLAYEVRYAPFWHETPDLTVAFYRNLLDRKTDGALIRSELFDSTYFQSHPPAFRPEPDEQAADPNDDFLRSKWFRASPRLVAWNNPPLAEITPAWDHFLKDLGASSDPVLQADALKFQFEIVHLWQNSYESFANDKDGPVLVDFLEQHQDDIGGPRGNDFLTGFDSTLHNIAYGRDKGPLQRLRLLGSTLLKKRVILPSAWFRWMPKIYDHVPTDEAKPLLTDFDAYRQWYQTQTSQDPALLKMMDKARRPLAGFAGVDSENPTAAPLTVSHHWPVQPNEEHTIEDTKALPFPPSLITEGNNIWFIKTGGVVIQCVDSSNLNILTSYTIPDQFLQNRDHTFAGGCLCVTPHYLVVAIFGRVLLCSLADHSWRQLDIPASNYRPCWVNQQLYLIYEAETDRMGYRGKGDRAATAISGIIRVSLPDMTIDNLVSTRRIPPQSPLDGKPLGFPLDLWDSTDGLMLAVDADSPHFQVFGTSPGKNDWASVATDPRWCETKNGAAGELIGKSFDEFGFAQIELMTGKTSEVLLSNPTRVSNQDNITPRWPIPDEIAAVPADVTWQAGAVMRGDDLCLYRNELKPTVDGFQTCFYYFPKGQKNGLKIPLKFQTNLQNEGLVKAQSMILGYQSLHTTDYGLVITQTRGGFWVIPWSDIDAYRTHGDSSWNWLLHKLHVTSP